MIQSKILKNSEWKFPKQQTFTPCNPVQQSAKLTNNLQHMKICKEITHPILRQSVVPTSTCQRLRIKGSCQFWKQWILWTFKAQFYSFTEKKNSWHSSKLFQCSLYSQFSVLPSVIKHGLLGNPPFVDDVPSCKAWCIFMYNGVSMLFLICYMNPMIFALKPLCLTDFPILSHHFPACHVWWRRVKTAIDPLIHTHQVAAAWRRRGFHVGGPGTATAAVPDRPSNVALWLWCVLRPKSCNSQGFQEFNIFWANYDLLVHLFGEFWGRLNIL